MIPAPASPAYRSISASLAEALERLHSRIDHGGDDEAQRSSAAIQRRLAPAKQRSRKEIKS